MLVSLHSDALEQPIRLWIDELAAVPLPSPVHDTEASRSPPLPVFGRRWRLGFQS